MGYYTSFDIDVNINWADPAQVAQVAEAAVMLSRRPEWIDYDADRQAAREESIRQSGDPFEFVMDDVYKWYDYYDDMHEVAKQFPDLEFIVTGYGEDRGDIWRAWFKGDKRAYQEAIIDFAPPEWSGQW